MRRALALRHIPHIFKQLYYICLVIETGAIEQLASLIAAMHLSGSLSIMAISCGFATFLSELSSNTAAASISIPVVTGLTKALGVNPIPYILGSIVAANCAYVLPISTRAIPIGHGLDAAEQIKYGLLLTLITLATTITTCRALVKKYPDTLLADRAFLQIANANRLKDTDESRRSAIQVYNSIIQMENSPLKPEAQFRIGEIMEQNAKMSAQFGSKPDYSSAMVAFKRCADAYPNSSFAGEAIKKVIDYYISIRDYNRAQETLDRVFQDYPDAPWLDEMLLKWGVVCHRLGNRADAIAKFRRLLEEYPGGSSAKQAANFLKKLER